MIVYLFENWQLCQMQTNLTIHHRVCVIGYRNIQKLFHHFFFPGLIEKNVHTCYSVIESQRIFENFIRKLSYKKSCPSKQME